MAVGVVSGWRVEVHGPDLRTVGACDVWTKLEATLRFRGRGAWLLDLPAGHPQAALFTPGVSVGVWAPWSTTDPLFTGPAEQITITSGSGQAGAQMVVSGVDDTTLLADRLVLPDPASALDAQGAESHWIDSGTGEWLIRRLAANNAGESALAARRILVADPTNRLSSPALLYGGSQTIACRFDNLLDAITGIAAVDGLGFQVIQPGGLTTRHLRVYTPTARPWVVFAPDRGNLKGWKVIEVAPKVTRALVAGQGEGVDRVLVERTAAAAESQWGRRVEAFRDARDSSDTAVLRQRGDELLAEGAQTSTVGVEPLDLPTLAFGRDYQLGDIVTARIGSLEVSDSLTALKVSVDAQGGAVFAPTLGNSDAGIPVAWQRTRSLGSRLDLLERRF